MNKSQILLLFAAAVTLAGLVLLGPTVAPKQKKVETHDHADTSGLDFNKLKLAVTGQLSTARQQYISSLENSVKRGDIKDQAIAANKQLATFWHDSVPNPLLHYHYAAAAAVLDNNEKSLTFAAHSILGYLPYAHNAEEQVWLANLGKQLFDKALIQNPDSDSSAVGLGGCLMYGASDASAQGPMAGILKVRAVAEKDSTNIFAQYMLGVGGIISRQYDKAALRFEKVAAAQPDNLEALFKLSEAYEMAGNKAKAIEWYKVIAQKVDDANMKDEIRKRIALLESNTGK